MNVTGNTILLTGGSAGIGLTLAEALLARGNRVLTCGRRDARLQAARQKLPALETLACDLASAAGRREWVAWAVHTVPALNVLINNAGVQHRIDLPKDDQSALRDFEEIDINLTAPTSRTAAHSEADCAAPRGHREHPFRPGVHPNRWCTRPCRRWCRAGSTITSTCHPRRCTARRRTSLSPACWPAWNRRSRPTRLVSRPI